MDKNSRATIISLKDVNNISGLCVTMDTSIENNTDVILSDGTVFKFKECGSGLYYNYVARTDEHNSAKSNATITSYSLL